MIDKPEQSVVLHATTGSGDSKPNSGVQVTETAPALAWYDIESVAKPLLNQISPNHDGIVTHHQLADALVNPLFHGAQAQAIAGLYGEFSEISRLAGGDGQSISAQSVQALYKTLYSSEKEASTLISLDDWTRAHFNQLDRDTKGFITSDDLRSAMSDTRLTDKNMLQLLDSKFSEVSPNGKLTADQLSLYVDNFLLHDKTFHFTDSFERMMDRANVAKSPSLSQDLYADRLDPQKSINSSAVQQGFANDCSFNAPLDSLAQQRPGDVSKMISVNADGTFHVKFPGAAKAVDVTAPTAAEQGILDGANVFGYWPALLEKAYGQTQIDADSQLQKKQSLPEDVLDKRAPLKNAIEILTGHVAQEKFLLYTSKADLLNILQNSFNSGQQKIVTLGTGSTLQSGTTKDGFALNHGFAVLAFSPDGRGDGTVLIRDTYGVGGNKGDGESTISLQQLKDNFTDIVYEQ